MGNTCNERNENEYDEEKNVIWLKSIDLYWNVLAYGSISFETFCLIDNETNKH